MAPVRGIYRVGDDGEDDLSAAPTRVGPMDATRIATPSASRARDETVLMPAAPVRRPPFGLALASGSTSFCPSPPPFAAAFDPGDHALAALNEINATGAGAERARPIVGFADPRTTRTGVPLPHRRSSAPLAARGATAFALVAGLGFALSIAAALFGLFMR